MFRGSDDVSVTTDKADTAGGVFSTDDPTNFLTSKATNLVSQIDTNVDLAVQAAIDAEIAKVAAELAETNAETAQAEAEAAASSIGNSVQEAQDAADYAEEWANKPEDSLVSHEAGGDLLNDYSALHHANKASASATAASTSESNASTSASNASISATNAGVSETNALASANNASTSETNAASSASDASDSATAAAASESNAATSESNAATSETNAATSASTSSTKADEASTSATNAQTSATNASNSASAALTSENNAATSETNASNSATSASNSATSAINAQTAAESARDSTLEAFDNFDDRYLGVKTSDPTLDNDDNALLAGSLYFNSTDGIMKVYTGSAWVAAYVSGQGFLSAANNLSDLDNTATARTNLGLGTTDSPTFTGLNLGTDVTFSWNSIDGTVDLDYGNVTLQVGQEQHFYAKATEAIANGDVVMFAGAQGDHLLISKADHSSVGFDPSYVIGVATQSFALNDFGYVTTFGKVRDLNTSGYNEGDILYFDPDTAGGLTTTKPTPPDHIIQMAAVTRSHATEGTILVRPSHTPDTDEIPEGSNNLYYTDNRVNSYLTTNNYLNTSSSIEDLSDVNSMTPTSGQLLTWDNTNSRWDAADAPVSLPDQTGSNGYYLTTDGTNASWAEVEALPDQTGNSGYYLTTDGSTASWVDAGNALQAKATYTATAGQTSFAINYDVGFVDVYLNGVRLVESTDFTASNGTSVVLTTGASLGDIVDLVAYTHITIADVYTKSQSDARYASQDDALALAIALG